MLKSYTAPVIYIRVSPRRTKSSPCPQTTALRSWSLYVWMCPPPGFSQRRGYFPVCSALSAASGTSAQQMCRMVLTLLSLLWKGSICGRVASQRISGFDEQTLQALDPACLLSESSLQRCAGGWRRGAGAASGTEGRQKPLATSGSPLILLYTQGTWALSEMLSEGPAHL